MKNNNSCIDENWFELIASGDDDAFASLYYASYKQVYGFLYSLTNNKEDAEDLLQNTFIKVRNGSHLYKKKGTPMTWICAIAKHEFIDFYRKYGKNPGVDYEKVEVFLTEDSSMASNDSKRVEDRMFIEEIMKTLDKTESSSIILHLVDGLKYREIADMLDMSLSTVLSKYHRAIKKIKNNVEE